MEVPIHLRSLYTDDSHPHGVDVWDVADGTIDENTGILAFAFKLLSDFSTDLVYDLINIPDGQLYENTVGYVWCRKGEIRSNEWDDHRYDGYRVILYGYFYEQGWEKRFSDGHTETAVWGYLTEANAMDVIDLISYWPGMGDIVRFLSERFDLPKRD